MKTLLVCYACIDAPSHKLIELDENDPIIGFCERWRACSGTAWIDGGNDKDHLIDMTIRIDAMESLPTNKTVTVDYVLHIAVY